MKLTAEQLHNWYLEAIEQIRPDSYNPDAVRPFKDLSLKQQAIDEYIVQKVLDEVKRVVESKRKNLPRNECINAENRMFGRCFDCEKSKGGNEVVDDILQELTIKEDE